MGGAPLPEREEERLAALHAYGVLDVAQDEAFNALVRVAATACEVPIALVSLVDEKRQWFLASIGLGVTSTPRADAFCAHTIVARESMMAVEDATLDPRFADNPLVLGDPFIRFYTGCALVDKAGFALGTLSVIDRVPRVLTPTQMSSLRELATAVVRLLEARKIDHALFLAEQSAKSARADLAMVMNSVSVPISYWDRNEINRFANPAFMRIFGHVPVEVRGRALRDVVGEALWSEKRPLFELALKGFSQHSAHALESDGRKHHFSLVLAPDIRDGVVHGVISTAYDVTELHEALHTSEQRNALLNLSEEVGELGHWRVEVGKEEIYWSPQVYRIYGRDPATFAPTLTMGVAAYHPDDRPRIADVIRYALEKKEPFDSRSRLVRPDGTVRYVIVRGRCELDPSTGEVASIFGVMQDITEQHELSARLALQERLVTAGTLAAGVGHEINNPLTYVAANIECAIDDLHRLAGPALTDPLRDVTLALEEARDGAERIRRIVHGLRAFAREEAVTAPTDVRVAVEVATNIALHEIKSTAQLDLQLDGAPLVLADETRLAQVLVNLLVNAAQAFTTKDPERNRIVVRARSAPRGRVCIEVEDNGPGIPNDVLPRIFDPFFTTKEVGRGTGLGLAVSHNIAASLGGDLSCETALGKGTLFRVMLSASPAASNPLDARAPLGDAQCMMGSVHAQPRGRLLVVDDEPSVLKIFDRVLRGEHDVVSLGDPREALRLLTRDDERFDLVLCDLMMPHLSGMALYERVSAAHPERAARFAFITGGATDEGVRAFLETVPNERLEKPFDSRTLRALVRRHLDRGAAGQG